MAKSIIKKTVASLIISLFLLQSCTYRTLGENINPNDYPKFPSQKDFEKVSIEFDIEESRSEWFRRDVVLDQIKDEPISPVAFQANSKDALKPNSMTNSPKVFGNSSIKIKKFDHIKTEIILSRLSEEKIDSKEKCILEIEEFEKYDNNIIFDYLAVFSAVTLMIIPRYHSETYKNRSRLIDVKNNKVLRVYDFKEQQKDVMSLLITPTANSESSKISARLKVFKVLLSLVFYDIKKDFHQCLN